MPFNRSLYPADWEKISHRIRFERANGRCEYEDEQGQRCKAVNYQPHPETGSKVVLTVAHLDHDTANNGDDNLRAYCQLHHLRYDAQHHARNAAETRRKRKVEAGQMELLP